MDDFIADFDRIFGSSGLSHDERKRAYDDFTARARASAWYRAISSGNDVSVYRKMCPLVTFIDTATAYTGRLPPSIFLRGISDTIPARSFRAVTHSDAPLGVFYVITDDAWPEITLDGKVYPTAIFDNDLKIYFGAKKIIDEFRLIAESSMFDVLETDEHFKFELKSGSGSLASVVPTVTRDHSNRGFADRALRWLLSWFI